MSYTFDDLDVGGQLRIGTGLCPALGEGNKKINGPLKVSNNNISAIIEIEKTSKYERKFLK